MLVLVLRVDGNHRFFINDLFHQTRDLGVPITYYNDTEDGVALVAKALIPGETVAVDKNWPARFLLRLQELRTGKCVNSSSIVDGVRAIKTPEEQEKMRIASRLNDQVMDRIIHALPEDHTETELADLLLQSGCGLLRLFLRAHHRLCRQCCGPPSCDGRQPGQTGRLRGAGYRRQKG